jgi:hypothetical protein
MKKIYLLAILAMGASSVFGQGKLDLRSLEVLRQYQAQTAGMQKTQAAEPKMVTAVVRLSGDNAVAALQKKGIEVLRQRDDLAIVQLPMDSVERQTYSLRHTIEDFIVYVRPPHGNSRNTRGRHHRRQLHKQQRHF